EQPRADPDQAWRHPDRAAVRVPVDPLWLRRPLELRAPVRHHFAAGLLGAHRAGLRTLAVLLERESGRDRHGPRGSGGHPADAGAILAAHERRPLARVAGVAALVSVGTEARAWRLIFAPVA